MASQEQNIKILWGSSCIATANEADTAYTGFGELADKIITESKQDLFSQLSKKFTANDAYGKILKIKVTVEIVDL